MQQQKRILLIILLFLISNSMNAQHTNYVSRVKKEVGFTIAANNQMFSSTFSVKQYWGVGKNKRKFKFGLGPRFTSSFGSNSLEYITAPAKLTSGKTGPSVFFADQIPSNIDTLALNKTQVNALNILLALHYDISKKLGVEFNIDLAGISFGGEQNGSLAYGDKVNATKAISAKPTFGNVLLISDNDLGSLNSEFIFMYSYNQRIRFNAGLAFLFNEYKIQNPPTYINSNGVSIDNDRFRTKSLMFGLGINYGF